MCLAVPGKIVAVDRGTAPLLGTVSFGGVRKTVCLELVPEASEGDYVIVHVGFAISRMNEGEATRVFDYLARAEALQENSQQHTKHRTEQP